METKMNNKKTQYFDIEIKTNILYDKDKKPYITAILDKYNDDIKYSIIRLFNLEIDKDINSLFENTKIYKNKYIYNTTCSPVNFSKCIMLTFRMKDIIELNAILEDALKVQENMPFIVSINIW